MNRIILRNVQLSNRRFKLSQLDANTTCAFWTTKFHTNNPNKNSLSNQPNIPYFHKNKQNYIQNKHQKFEVFNVRNDKYQRNHMIGSYDSKEECMKELKQTSDYLLENLKTLRWNIYAQLMLMKNMPKFSEMKAYIGNTDSFNLMINFMHANIDKFDVHEKSTIFKLISVIDHLAEFEINKNLRQLFLKLEIDFYDNIDKCNLFDINNYNLVYKYFSKSNIFFHTKSLDSFFRLLSTYFVL
jgi:hypothetical protein